MESMVDRDTYRSKDIMNQECVDFEHLFLSKSLLHGLHDIGFKRPSPIQLNAIPIGKCGFDLIVQSKNGTGKTCVFSVIALESIDVEAKCIQVLILAPTREIAMQIFEVLTDFSKYMSQISCQLFIGGTSLTDDAKRLRNCQIAIATPGRFEHFLKEGIADIDSIRLFILDEADKLLEKEFEEAINWIYSSLPVSKQIIACSATMPEWLAKSLQNYMHQPTTIRLNTKQLDLIGVTQYIKVVKTLPTENIFKAKCRVLLSILPAINFTQCIIYSCNQVRSEDICEILLKNGWSVAVIGSGQDQICRLQAIQRLKSKQCNILVSTDLTARGLDVPSVDLVINIDLPMSFDIYLHRIGRAGRFGRYGASISLVSEGNEQYKMNRITKLCRVKLQELPDNIPADLTKYSPEKDQIVNEYINGLKDYDNTDNDLSNIFPHDFNNKSIGNISLTQEFKRSTFCSNLDSRSDMLNEPNDCCIEPTINKLTPVNEIMFDSSIYEGKHLFETNFETDKSNLNSHSNTDDGLSKSLLNSRITTPNSNMYSNGSPKHSTNSSIKDDLVCNDASKPFDNLKSNKENLNNEYCDLDNGFPKLCLNLESKELKFENSIKDLVCSTLKENSCILPVKNVNCIKYTKSELYEIGKTQRNIEINNMTKSVVADLKIMKNLYAKSNLNKSKFDKNKASIRYDSENKKHGKNNKSSQSISSRYEKTDTKLDINRVDNDSSNLLNNINTNDIIVKKYIYSKDELLAIRDSHLSILKKEDLENMISNGIYVKNATKDIYLRNNIDSNGIYIKNSIKNLINNENKSSELRATKPDIFKVSNDKDHLEEDSNNLSMDIGEHKYEGIPIENTNSESIITNSVTDICMQNNQLETTNFMETELCYNSKIPKFKTNKSDILNNSSQLNSCDEYVSNENNVYIYMNGGMIPQINEELEANSKIKNQFEGSIGSKLNSDNKTIYYKNEISDCDNLFNNSSTKPDNIQRFQLESVHNNGFESGGLNNYKLSKKVSSQIFFDNLELNEEYQHVDLVSDTNNLISKSQSSKTKLENKQNLNVSKNNSVELNHGETKLKNKKSSSDVSSKRKKNSKIKNTLNKNASEYCENNNMAYFYWSQYQYHLYMSNQYKKCYDSITNQQHCQSVFNNCQDYIVGMSCNNK